MISHSISEGNLTIKLTNVDSVFSTAFSTLFRATFERFYSDFDSKKINRIIIFLTGDYSEYTDTSRSLIECLTLAEIVDRISFFRNFCRMIRVSEIPWIFIGDANCLGQLWEVALACHFRYWTRSNAFIGISEIREEVFPAFGVYEDLVQQLRLTKADIATHYKQTAQDLHRKGLLKLLPENASVAEFDKIFKSATPVVSSKAAKKGTNTFWVDLPAKTHIQCRSTLQQLENDVDDALKVENQRSYNLNRFFDLIKDKKKPNDEKIILHYAHHLFSQRHLSWLYRRSSHLEYETNPLKPRVKTSLYIDLEETIPPTSCIKALLHGNYHLVFFHEHLEILRKSLEIIYSRIESEMGLDLVQQYFNSSIDWVNRTPVPTTGWTARWRLGGEVVFQFKNLTFRYFRLAGNHSSAPLGWYECSSDHALQNRHQIQDLESCLAFGVVPVTDKHRFIRCELIRSVFWSELLYTAMHLIGTSPTKLIGILKKFGWDFAGDELAWSQFLKNRFEMETNFTAFDSLCRDDFFEKTLHSVAIEDFTPMLKFKGEKKGAYSESMANRHLLCFVSALTHLLVTKNPEISKLQIDVMLSQAVGFPRNYGTPVLFMESIGIPATTYTLKKTGLRV